MPRLPRRIAVVIVCSSLLAVAVPARAAVSDEERMARAVGFIASQQNANGSIPAFSPIGSTADAVLAFVAARTGAPSVRAALGYLARQADRGNVTDVGLQAKVALAFHAAGRDPRNVGGENLILELREAYGGGAAPGVFDTTLAVLAVEAAGASVPAATSFLVANQCPDGGWPFDRYDPETEGRHCFDGDAGSDAFLSDTNSTALAIMALEAADRDATTDPFAFLRTIRDDVHGGWGYTWGVTTTDANSTALVLQAYAAAGRETPRAARRALRSLQYTRCGAFAFTFDGDVLRPPDLGATIGAVPGLAGLAMPFEAEVSGAAPTTPACPTT